MVSYHYHIRSGFPYQKLINDTKFKIHAYCYCISHIFLNFLLWQHVANKKSAPSSSVGRFGSLSSEVAQFTEHCHFIWTSQILYKFSASTFKLALTRDMVLLTVVFIYTGIELTFWIGIYSTSLAFTNKFSSFGNFILAYNALAIGVGQLIGTLCVHNSNFVLQFGFRYTYSPDWKLWLKSAPGRALCTPGRLMGADSDKTRLSQWRALLRLFAPSGAIVRGASHLGQRSSSDQGCRGRARARFLVAQFPVGTVHTYLPFHIWWN